MGLQNARVRLKTASFARIIKERTPDIGLSNLERRSHDNIGKDLENLVRMPVIWFAASSFNK